MGLTFTVIFVNKLGVQPHHSGTSMFAFRINYGVWRNLIKPSDKQERLENAHCDEIGLNLG